MCYLNALNVKGQTLRSLSPFPQSLQNLNLSCCVIWSVLQQRSGLASVIVFCQRGCQLVTVLNSVPSPQRFLGSVFTKPSKAMQLFKGKGQASLGMFLKSFF